MKHLCACAIALIATTAIANGATIVPNSELNIVGAGGTPVTTVGIGGGNAAAQSWLQDVIDPGTFLTTDVVPSTDPFLLPALRGNMMRVFTNGFSPGGGAGNGIAVVFIGDQLPPGSTGSIDINIEVAGTFGELGFVENTQAGTRFDPVGSVFFGGNQQTGWQRLSFSNPTQETGAFELEILFHPQGADVGQVSIDHLTISAAPEPGGLWAAVPGLALLIGARLRGRTRGAA
jgi:hypothetical protein